MLVGATGMGWWQEPTAPAVALGYDAAGNGFTLLRALSILGANVPTGLLARRMAPGAGFGAAEVLEEGVGDGALRPLDTWNTAYLVSGALSATVFRWIRGQLPVALQDYVPILLDMLLCGLRSEHQP